MCTRRVVSVRPQQRIVRIAHDVLADGVEAVNVVGEGPGGGVAVFEEHVVGANAGLEKWGVSGGFYDGVEGKKWCDRGRSKNLRHSGLRGRLLLRRRGCRFHLGVERWVGDFFAQRTLA